MLIGIALAAYQPDPTIFLEQLNSIQNQDFKNWICVITCDSPLQPLTADPRFKPLLEDRRFQWVENEVRLGHKKNFEKAIQKVASLQQVTAIACSDQDDIWYPNKLSKGAEALDRQGKLGLVHSDMHILNGTGILPKTAWQIERRGINNTRPAHLLVRNIVAGCSMLFDAELARRFPKIPEEAEFHDHWYALVASYYGGIGAIDQPLYAYRQHGGNEVGVSPFVGTFTLPKQSTPASILQKCRNGWTKSFRLAQAAERAGLPLTEWEKSVFLRRSDWGRGLLCLGVSQLKTDPPLARACLARGLGKMLIKR